MRIVIAGGSGQVGTVLARAFQRDGHEIVVLSRHPRPAPWSVESWDGQTLGPWGDTLDGADLLVNLAGHSVNCRYHRANRDRIMASRVDSVRVLGEAIQRAARPPRTWLQACTATIYAHRFDAPNDEESGLIGGQEPDVPDTWRFSIDVATAWEAALDEAETPGTRKLKLRSAMIMSPDQGGIFDILLGLVRRGLGGACGDGKQYVSWIHHADFVRALRSAWGARIGLPAARWMLEIGAFFLRTETELMLKSRRVVPGVLLGNGFDFLHPTWPDAARSLCREWRDAS